MSIQFIDPAIAGAVGGAAIAGIGMVYQAARGNGFWSLPNSIGGIVLGPEAGATRPFGVPTLTGVGFHMVLSAIYGILAVWLAPKLGIGLIATGALVGLVVWGVNHAVIGSVLPGARYHRGVNPLWMAFLLHALYGAITGAVAQILLG